VTEPVYRVTDTTEHFHGNVFSAHTDVVAMPDGGTAVRDYVRHTGAVAVVAVDDQERVVLVRQYRHPVRTVLWELPAGLRDVAGEDQATAAARELAEEAGVVAAQWEPLVAVYTSPGYSDERIEIFLARQLTPVGPEFDFERVFEEAHMTVHHLPLEEAAAMVGRGEIINGVCAVGVLAAWHRLRT
jgi:ADP-ribose pyrophosphatase